MLYTSISHWTARFQLFDCPPHLHSSWTTQACPGDSQSLCACIKVSPATLRLPATTRYRKSTWGAPWLPRKFLLTSLPCWLGPHLLIGLLVPDSHFFPAGYTCYSLLLVFVGNEMLLLVCMYYWPIPCVSPDWHLWPGFQSCSVPPSACLGKNKVNTGWTICRFPQRDTCPWIRTGRLGSSPGWM